VTYRVRFTDDARTDLLELHEFLAAESPEAADRALGTIERGLGLLEEFPWSCRRATGPALGSGRFRELVLRFGRRGYVALFEIEDEETVTVLAVRHQREGDYR
jgi:plasmid stabilization system protein ParE